MDSLFTQTENQSPWKAYKALQNLIPPPVTSFLCSVIHTYLIFLKSSRLCLTLAASHNVGLALSPDVSVAGTCNVIKSLHKYFF